MAAVRALQAVPRRALATAWAAKPRRAPLAPLRKTLVPCRVNTSAASPRPRPLSPHVTIYKFPIIAISSITHRVTGSALWFGMTGMGLAALAGTCDFPSYVAAFQVAAPLLVPVAKAAVAFPFAYHAAAGVRHLAWDKTARGLDLKSAELSTYAVFGVSGALTLALAATTI